MRPRHGSAGRSPDWSKLPAEFAYIIAAAERYGRLALPDGSPRRELRKRQLRDLRAIARQIGEKNHDLLLQSWCIERSIAEDLREERLVGGLLDLLQAYDFDVSDAGPKQEPEWTLSMWDRLHYRLLDRTLPEHTRKVLPEEQAFEVASNALGRVPEKELGAIAMHVLCVFRSARPLDWMETHAPPVVAPGDWGFLAALPEFSWQRAESWLARGRPLSLIALDALRNLAGESESPIVREAKPTLLSAPALSVAEDVLRAFAAKDSVPRVERAVAYILENWSFIAGQQPSVRGHAPPRPLDWSRIPAEFHYLIEPAERYGPMFTDKAIRGLERKAIAGLEQVGKQIGWHNHDLALRSWIHHIVLPDENADKPPENETEEARLIDGLLILLFRLGIETSDYGPRQEPDWTLHAWETFHPSVLRDLVEHTREVFSDEEAFRIITNRLTRLPRQDVEVRAYELLQPLQTSLTLGWIEARSSQIDRSSASLLGRLAAVSELSWPRVEVWLARGRPLSVIALSALSSLAGAPGSDSLERFGARLLEPPSFAIAEATLKAYAASDPTPRVSEAVSTILERWPHVMGGPRSKRGQRKDLG